MPIVLFLDMVGKFSGENLYRGKSFSINLDNSEFSLFDHKCSLRQLTTLQYPTDQFQINSVVPVALSNWIRANNPFILSGRHWNRIRRTNDLCFYKCASSLWDFRRNLWFYQIKAKKKPFRVCYSCYTRKRSKIEKQCVSVVHVIQGIEANTTYFVLKNMLNHTDNDKKFLFSASLCNTSILYRFSFYCIRIWTEYFHPEWECSFQIRIQ